MKTERFTLRDIVQATEAICCNVASQWAEGCLRAYLLDTQEKSVQPIVEQATVGGFV